MADNNKPTGFTFGAPAAGGFSFGTPAASNPSAPPAFGLTATPSAPAATGFSFSTPSTTSTTAAPAAAPSLSFGFGSTAKPAAAPVTAASTGFASQIQPPATSAAPLTLSAPTATLGTAAATTTTGGIGISTSSIAPITTTTAAATVTANPLTNLTTTTSTTQSAAAQPGSQLNFCQLEEHINKWTLELEEQEKIFSNQATQINAWDRVLIENSDKIVSLNDAFKKVKVEQKALEHELEYIAAQHAELDECIKPLEKEMSKSQQFDPEREQTYLMAESLDTQLKQMGEDLKEVIEHLNEANKDRDPNDPIVQIGKILNAHMSSLQWIENSTSHITAKLENISKLQESLRRDNERSFRLNI